jgi:hypothetical protein
MAGIQPLDAGDTRRVEFTGARIKAAAYMSSSFPASQNGTPQAQVSHV